ncbi:MAG TPA: PhnA domain-containing protein [Pseudomonadales bacterium]
MKTEQALLQRCDSHCELCKAGGYLSVYTVPPATEASTEHSIMLCDTCRGQIEQPDTTVINHWHCLNDSMWSEVPAVQVMAWRQLKHLSAEPWAQDLLDMLYLDDERLAWAQATEAAPDNHDPATLDSNGTPLQAGDTVTLIKDLEVKGAGFTAKRGTAVRGIALTGNPEQIEGKVNGVQIVLLTKFLKKA